MQPTFSRNMVAGFNEKDERYAARWFETYYPVIFSKVSELTKGSVYARDLVQDVSLRVLKRRGKFKNLRGIELYMKKVIDSICRDFLRKEQTPKDRQQDVIDLHDHLERKSIKNAQVRTLFQRLNDLATEMLPEMAKRVYHLYYHEELSNKEIAELLGISEKTVEYHKGIVHQKLKIGVAGQSDVFNEIRLSSLGLPVIALQLLIQKFLS